MIGKRFKIALTVFSITFIFLNGKSQAKEWKDYLPYNRVTEIVNTKEKVYAATSHAVIVIDKEEKKAERLSKLNELSGTNIRSLAYSEYDESVVIGYQSGKIDVIKDNIIRTYTDIERATQYPERGVRSIMIKNDSAFLGTQFGIVLFNLTRREVSETYMIGPGGESASVNTMHIFNDTIYAGTENGIYKASILNPNLRLPPAWSKMQNIPLQDSSFNLIFDYNEELIINKTSNKFKQDSLIIRGDNGWYTPPVFESNNFHDINYDPVTGYLIICANDDVKTINSQFEQERNVFTYQSDEQPQPRAFDLGDVSGELWIGDHHQGAVRNFEVWENDIYHLESPVSKFGWNFHFDNEKTYVAGGGLQTSLAPTFSGNGFAVLNNNNGEWKNFNNYYYPELDGIYDFLDVIPDPTNNDRLYIATVSDGLIEMENEQITNIYNASNTVLGGEDVDESDINMRISKLEFDQNNNLWMSIFGTLTPIAVKIADNEGFVSYEFPGVITPQDRVSEFIITDNGYKWIAVRQKGIFVFDDNGTPNDKEDDQFRLLTSQEGRGDLPSNNVQSLDVDQSGRVWVGTEEGTAVFFSASNIFSEDIDIDAQQVFVEVDGFTQYLLEGEMVTAVAVDGADRKWFGTSTSGVFLMSSDGTEEILRFTEENSPLISDQIINLDVNPYNGEVMIATEEGIIAYRGTATRPDPNMMDVYAYPNPVYPHYTGRIRITGLARNAGVKITDINGNLVFDTRAEGGTAVWNGKNQNGTRVPTGVYLVFAADEQGQESVATKIMFVN